MSIALAGSNPAGCEYFYYTKFHQVEQRQKIFNLNRLVILLFVAFLHPNGNKSTFLEMLNS